MTPEDRAAHCRRTQRQLTRDEWRKRQKVRAEARRLYPDLTCDHLENGARCGEKADRHHIDGCDTPDANHHVVGLCPEHHRQERRRRQEQRWAETHPEAAS